ncbi:MAG: hypothetical protein GF346_04255 [Candidatus Eisenbacteria bacterium]|nr:hypothetical protein [Candidatus Latescibacterota bacterium]MBD3301639.1 hypothetical protein [Candidatus Eisenbacteria bacterium]
MFNVGSQEILIILLLVFLLFGPRHIPQVANSLGRGLGEIRRTLSGIEDSVRRGASELPDPDLDRHSPARGARPERKGFEAREGPSEKPGASVPRERPDPTEDRRAERGGEDPAGTDSGKA